MRCPGQLALMKRGRNHPGKENRELLGLLLGDTLRKFVARSPPQERCLQIELFGFQANVCSCEGISRRGDAGSF